MVMAKTKNYQIQLSKNQLFFTVLSLILCFLLTFALGAITGIRYFGNSSDPLSTSFIKEEADTPPGMNYGSLESHTISDTEGEKVIHQFTFYDTLPETPDSPMPQDPPQSKENRKQEPDPTEKTDKNIELSKDAPHPYYTIQFGSFQEKEKADALSNKLNKQGLLAHVSTTHIKNRGTFYRVQMGTFDTQEKAKQWASTLPPLSPPPFITSIKD